MEHGISEVHDQHICIVSLHEALALRDLQQGLVGHLLFASLNPGDADNKPAVCHELPPTSHEDRLAELERVDRRLFARPARCREVRTSLAPAASSPLAGASLLKRLANPRRVGHPLRGLLHRVSRPVVLLAVLAPVARGLLNALLGQQSLDALFAPRCRPCWVFVEEVPSSVQLLLIQLAHEPQVEHGTHPLSVHNAGISLHRVEGLPA